jgi:filamentous hemagglutinin family protein
LHANHQQQSNQPTDFSPTIHLFLAGIALVAISLGTPPTAQGQIIPDATLGNEASTPNATTLDSNPAQLIEGGAQRGSNLFHSFSEFNVAPEQQVYFATPNGIQRIFSRVTGTNPSEIAGTLGVLGAADLFLLNPNGIVFGPNARLDVNGAFIATSADSILFENNRSFSASNPQAPPLLTVNMPLGLQMGTGPGRLLNQSVEGLEVPPQQTLAFIGGELLFDQGILLAPGGHIEMAALGDNATVAFEPTNGEYALESISQRPLLPVTLIGQAIADVSGEGKNYLQVQGSRLHLIQGAALLAVNYGQIDETRAIVTAPEGILLSGTLPNGIPGGIFLRVFGTGNAADLLVNTSTLTIESGAAISASTFAEGNAGNITINATEALNVTGLGNVRNPTGIFANSRGNGNAGNLAIQTGQLRLLQGGSMKVNSEGAGAAGNITVHASEFVEIDGASPGLESIPEQAEFPSDLGASNLISNLDSGRIEVNTRRLSITNGGQILALTLGPGKAGDIFLGVTDLIEVRGSSDRGNFNSAIANQTQGEGDAGNIHISTARLLLQNNGSINSDTTSSGNGGTIAIEARDIDIARGHGSESSPTGILSGVLPAATGEGGAIVIRGDRLVVSNGGEISAATLGSGNSGTLDLRIQDTILVTGRHSSAESPSQIETGVENTGTGNSRNIFIETGNLTVRDGGELSATTSGAGNAGNITINAREKIQAIGNDSNERSLLAVASLENATGRAGSLNLHTPQLVVQDGGTIAVSSFNSTAGNLNITAEELLLDSGRLSASVASGIAGGITNINEVTLLVLRNGSIISAQGGEVANGGNINMNAENGFVVAVERENSDITASAERGNGGNINITAQGVFGLTVNPLADRLAVSEINASSEAGVDGTVAINEPNVTLEAVTALPTAFRQPSITQSCDASASDSRFTHVGRGGVPANPTDPLTSYSLWHDFLEIDSLALYTTNSPASPSHRDRFHGNTNPNGTHGVSQPPQLEANGWLVEADGTVQLVARQPASPPESANPACPSHPTK